MASIRPPPLPSPSRLDPNPSKFPNFLAPSPRFNPPSKKSSCCCRSSRPDGAPSPSGGGGDAGGKRWDSLLLDAVKSAVKRWDDYISSYRKLAPKIGRPALVNLKKEEEEEMVEEAEWDWERWKRHFGEVEDQEMVVSLLKMQLSDAINREDYEEASKLKLAIAAAVQKDAVGTAMHNLNRAIEHEHYNTAAFLRDHAGAGLLGWWAGISEDASDPYGRIIHISAKHGRYMAKSYSSRQLTTATPGDPLFEIFFTVNDGEYKQQAVYLKRKRGHPGDLSKKSIKKSVIDNINQSDSGTEGQNDIHSDDGKTTEEGDDASDEADGLAGIQNVLQDLIPGVKVKVLKVVSSSKVDRDLIAKIIEQKLEEEDEDSDEEFEDTEAEDVKGESDIEEIEMDARDASSSAIEEQDEVSVKIVISTLIDKLSGDVPPNDLLRVPARLEKRGRKSFLFSVQQDDTQTETDRTEQTLQKKAAQQKTASVLYDVTEAFRSKERIPLKVLKDVGELISLGMNQIQHHQSLSGATLFNRIDMPTTSDPLSGLYVGAHGIYTSEVLHLKRKFGQWQEDDANKDADLEFYEYVEASTLTGGLSVPAGQVAFRAKVGKRNQLPHKGIIPEEFCVVARYKGQGRLADPSIKNPQWVDGELVILDGKYIRGGPVIGFVYWAPEYHFLVFFNRLRLPD